MFVSTLGLSAPVRAADPPDPAARLQFVIHKIHIIDDEDWLGSGNEKFFVDLCGDSLTSPYNRSFACGPGASSAYEYAYDASSGDDITVERVSPREGDYMEGGTSPEGGIPVYAGQHYIFTADMFDRDPAYAFDTMGDIFVHVDEEHNWGIGTHTVRSIQENGDPGDYELTFEIRRAPLPELLNRGIHIVDAGDGLFYCVTVQNVGERPSGLIPLAVRADGALVRATTLPALDEGQTTEHCVIRSELPARQHQLSFMVDEARQIPEMNETDNYYEWKIPAIAPAAGVTGATADPQPVNTAPGTAPSPQPKPSGTQPEPSNAQPDLVVRAIRTNGQPIVGKTSCTTGVTVVVRNDGKANADSFVLRLSVDGDKNQTSDRDVKGLAAGQEREVRFDDVRLKAGERVLGAIADADHSVDEANEENNDSKISVLCKAGA
jgi:hypothetical protein